MRKNEHRGIFILVEGLDGAGKTTALKEFIKDKNQNSVRFAYMKGAARQDFWNGFARRHPSTPLFLLELIATTLGPLRRALEAGENIIMDKYFFFVASHVPDVDTRLNRWLIKLARPFMLRPDLIIYFTVNKDERLRRLRAGKPNPHHEKLCREPALAVYRDRYYRDMVNLPDTKTVELDTTFLSVEQTVGQLNKIIHDFLRART